MLEMTISFHNVTPAPLAGVIDLKTGIWEKHCLFLQGQRYKILAPSGKGKSTFIHYIYGLRDDYAGEVRFNDQVTKMMSADEWAELRQAQISIVYQDLRLFLNLTALQNLTVKSALYKDVPEEKILSMADRVQVKGLLHKKCSTLSYGERQRVAIIRGLLQPFSWLLLDEPFSHLDKVNVSAAAAMIDEEVARRNAGLVVTSLGENDPFEYDREIIL